MIKVSVFTLKLYMVEEKISRLCRVCLQLYQQIMLVDKFRCETRDISVKYQCGSHNLGSFAQVIDCHRYEAK